MGFISLRETPPSSFPHLLRFGSVLAVLYPFLGGLGLSFADHRGVSVGSVIHVVGSLKIHGLQVVGWPPVVWEQELCPWGQTVTSCVPMYSASNSGSPSSRSISITSRRFPLSSSRDSPWECAPGNPGTNPTSRPVQGHFSMTAVNERIINNLGSPQAEAIYFL